MLYAHIPDVVSKNSTSYPDAHAKYY